MLENKATTGILLILVAWLAILALGTRRASQQARLELGELEKKITAIEQENKQMEKLQERFKTSAYLEKQARAKLNYKNPDETVVFVYKNDEFNEIASGSAEPKWWQKFFDFLKF